MSSSYIPIEAIRDRGRIHRPPPAARRSCIFLAAVALVITVLMLLLLLPGPAAAQAVRGDASVVTTGGYARLVIKLAEEVEAQVRSSGGILVIQFRRPVDIAVDRIPAGAGNYFAAARRDPDGKALRFALSQKVRVNSMAAAERLFVDLLPETWTAEPPGLPREIVEELANRTREAERYARLEQAKRAQEKKIPTVRVRVASHPTFTRYIFELPEMTGVSSERGRDRLTLTFAAPIKFETADAKVGSPKSVSAIDATLDTDSAAVKFAFGGAVDVRAFREDFNYVVDVSPVGQKAADGKPAPATPGTGPLAGLEPPDTVPAKPGTPGAPAKSAAASAKAAMPGVGGESEAPDGAPPAAAPTPAAAPEVAANDTPEPPAAPQAAPPRRDPNRPVSAELRRQGDTLRVRLPFLDATPAAVFQRADTLWLVFDTPLNLDLTALDTDPSRTIRNGSLIRMGDAQVVRLKLERPRLVSLVPDGTAWVLSVGEAVHEPTRPLTVARHLVAPGRASVAIPFDDPRQLHRLEDPEIGDTLLVITGFGPARGLVKTQDFVEFRALATTHGVVIQPFADDLNTEVSADKILLSRPGGLTLSEAVVSGRRAGPARAVIFDTAVWKADRDADFNEKQADLIRAAADAPFTRRGALRMDLARFYLSRGMFHEAKAVLDLAVNDDRPTADDPTALVMRAVTNIMLNRIDSALKDLGNPLVGNQNDAQLWRALANARLGKWAEARDGFRYVEGALGTLPLELQRLVLRDSLRASIEVGDFATAVTKLNDFETVGISREIEPEISVLTGRLAERMGRTDDALSAYRFAAESPNEPAAAQARLRAIALRSAIGEFKKPQVIEELEKLTTAWRGDETEAEALQMMARLYTEESRYRDAFTVMRVALGVHPNSELTRKIQQEASVTFDSLFLSGKADSLSAVEALGLFYDYRELTPIGRRGDEMIRRLADRLVSVDLLDQGAELLQYQVDHRLQGAARAQVATKLAMIYLLSHKPDRAQATLRATRTADLSNEVRSQRLLIEARALSEIGRHDLALEVIENITDREAIRLRADIYWSARRWQKSAEQIELLHADRWNSFEPLTDIERMDILRAGIGHALAEDRIGISRLREKFSAKMAQGPDGRAFEVVTGGLSPNSAEFRAVARMVSSIDTLDAFMREMRARFPEIATLPSGRSAGVTPPNKVDLSPTGAVEPAR